MPREKTKTEIDNENRARAGMNALARLRSAVRFVPHTFTKVVYDLLLDAERAVQLNEVRRAAIANRSTGMTDILDSMQDDGSAGLLTILSEIVRKAGDICLTESAVYIEAQDIDCYVNALAPFRAEKAVV